MNRALNLNQCPTLGHGLGINEETTLDDLNPEVLRENQPELAHQLEEHTKERDYE